MKVEGAQRWQRFTLAAGLVGGILAILGIFLSGPERFFQSYLAAYLFWFGLTMGALAVLFLHYLVTGGWGFLIQPGLEAATRALVWMALLFLPLVFGLQDLYPWAQPEAVAANPLLQHKAPYLNTPFFLFRAGLYFMVWLLLSQRLIAWSRRQEYIEDPVYRRRRQQLSSAGLILYVLTMTFASIDWIMSLNPEWVSTIFGFLVITGQALSGLALGIALLPLLLRSEPLASWGTPGRIRDLGALLLTMVIFWAYIAFSQYLIIWSGNIPREVTWFIDRSEGGWIWLFLAVLAIQFILPFIVLLSLQAKRNLRIITGLSLAIVVTRWGETFWMVMPSFYPQRLTLHWLDLALTLAIGGVWATAFLWNLNRTPTPLIPSAGREEHAAIPGQRQGTVR